MTVYQRHKSSKLNALFEAKPYQGQNPEKARLIFIGNDANYFEEIAEHDFFKYIEEYHSDGCRFWKKYGVHHPFLIDSYPFNKRSGGVPYQRTFSKLNLSKDHANFISFVELLDVPTTGVTSTDENVFWSLINLEHLQWIDSVLVSEPPKLVFLTRGVFKHLLQLKKRFGILSWLSDVKIKTGGMQTIYEKNGTEIVVAYSLSARQIYSQLGTMSNKIKGVLI